MAAIGDAVTSPYPEPALPETAGGMMDGLEKWWTIGLLPAVWLVWWLWWKLPKREVAKLRHSIRDPKDRVDVEDTLRKTIGQALGAIAVLVGAGFALAQFLEQRDTAQKQLQASHDLLISNQIAKGFEQLGSEKIELRLGGIYALEGILRMPPTSSPDYRKPVLDALCAFVRERTIGMTVPEPKPIPLADVQVGMVIPGLKLVTDVQAVLTVIGRRPEGVGRPDLSGAIIPGADLINANLIGAYLSLAKLRANLTNADLSNAVLLGTDLIGAYLIDAKLSGARLAAAKLSTANLSNADLSSADLWLADLSNADLSGANLSNANLTGANLTDAHLDNQEQLGRACGKPKVLPEGFTLDRPCPQK